MEKFIIISLIAVMGWISYSQYTEVYLDKGHCHFNNANKKVLKPVHQHAHVISENRSTQ
ncbi:MAG: hypothetical protein WCO93_06080 [bacterium]